MPKSKIPVTRRLADPVECRLALETHEAVAMRGFAKMQGIGNIHPAFREIEGFGHEAGIFNRHRRSTLGLRSSRLRFVVHDVAAVFALARGDRANGRLLVWCTPFHLVRCAKVRAKNDEIGA